MRKWECGMRKWECGMRNRVEWVSRNAEVGMRNRIEFGANYREANRARSKAEFRAKIGIVEQESDESLYWLEILKESGIAKGEILEELLVEADELVAIFTTIGRKSK